MGLYFFFVLRMNFNYWIEEKRSYCHLNNFRFTHSGELKIAEVKSRFEDLNKFIELLENLGFRLLKKVPFYNFDFIEGEY